MGVYDTAINNSPAEDDWGRCTHGRWGFGGDHFGLLGRSAGLTILLKAKLG